MAPNASLDLPVGGSAALPHLQIVDKLQELALVTSALGYANERYAALKASSTLVNSTLERAETTITAVVTTGVVPAVLNKFEQPIHYADNIAVQGLDYTVAKIGVISKQSEELKDSATKVVGQTRQMVDQTKERAMSKLVSVKASAVQTVQARVHTVLTLPSNAVPLLEQILSAGESVLDYLLPEVKPVANGTSTAPGTSTEETNAADTKAFIRLVISRMRQFTDKVHRRVVDYSRERWMPALFTSATTIKGNVLGLLANGTANAGKLLAANGHSASSAASSKNASSPAKATTTPKKNASSPAAKATTSSPTSPASSNGGVKSSSDDSATNLDSSLPLHD